MKDTIEGEERTIFYNPKRTTRKSVRTLGRNVGFTGRIAVFEGRTLSGEKPNIVPERQRAALAESDEIHSNDNSGYNIAKGITAT